MSSFIVHILISDMYFYWPLGWCIISFFATGDLVGKFWSPKASEWEMFIHRSLWYEGGPWLKGRYPPVGKLVAVVPQIPLMGCMIFFASCHCWAFLACLSIMRSLMPREEKKVEFVLQRMCSFRYPISIIWHPYTFSLEHLVIEVHH